ncbi:MAG: hypothetical protein HFI30_15615 [Lachnospiraceae bacterium]|jgi:hypothetical protein|nr:hypothetical protein [Lachnospiraceae bacterium]
MLEYYGLGEKYELVKEWYDGYRFGETKIYCPLEKASLDTRDEIERLIAGESIWKAVNEELAYKDLYENLENVWGILFATGYLTQSGEAEGEMRRLKIPNREKENFYHGFLLGLLRIKEDWKVLSNKESGKGYADILIEIFSEKVGLVIEVKYAENGNLSAGCEEALAQVKRSEYTKQLYLDGMKRVIACGIACHIKDC